MTRMEAHADGKNLSVALYPEEGMMETPRRVLRIGYIRKGKIIYSKWQEGTSATMKIK